MYMNLYMISGRTFLASHVIQVATTWPSRDFSKWIWNWWFRWTYLKNYLELISKGDFRIPCQNSKMRLPSSVNRLSHFKNKRPRVKNLNELNWILHFPCLSNFPRIDNSSKGHLKWLISGHFEEFMDWFKIEVIVNFRILTSRW